MNRITEKIILGLLTAAIIGESLLLIQVRKELKMIYNPPENSAVNTEVLNLPPNLEKIEQF